MYLIYWKGRVGKSVKKLLDFLKLENKMVDDKDLGVNFYVKNQNKINFVIPSPGIKPDHSIYKIWNNKIIWEIDLVDKLMKQLGIREKYIFIGVTGTDWKSTTTWRIYNFLQKYLNKKYDIYIWGNFDRPVSDIFLESIQRSDNRKNIFVIEVSSFMAYNLKKTKFFASFWTNFDIDHQDRHEDITDYRNSKMNLFNLTPVLKYPNLSKKLYFQKFNTGVEDLVNFLKLLLTNLWVELNEDTIKEDIEKIPPLPHRFQLYKVINWINIYDDWKCTTAQCQRYALEKMLWKCVLIAWWFDKGIDYSVNIDIYKNKVSYWIFFGDVGKKLKILFDSLKINCQYFSNFDTAIIEALKIAKSGKIKNVLFSPWASSFDMFNNRHERVKKFLEIINSIDEI